MRMLLRAQMSTEAGNAAFRDGTIAKKLQAILGDMKPEAVYLVPMNGKRTALVFFDLPDVAQMPMIAEPWFLTLGAEIELSPAFTPAELGSVESALGEVVKKYG